MNTTISGNLIFSPPLSSLSNVNIYIRCEEQGLSGDVSPQIVAERIRQNVQLGSNPVHSIPFSIEIPTSKLLQGCNLRVHVDLNRTGSIESGDYITTQSVVLSQQTTSLDVVVERI